MEQNECTVVCRDISCFHPPMLGLNSVGILSYFAISCSRCGNSISIHNCAFIRGVLPEQLHENLTTLSKIFRAAARGFEVEGTFVQHMCACDARGCAVAGFDRAAVKWSLCGMLEKVLGDSQPTDVAIHFLEGMVGDIDRWNDAEGRKQEEVRILLLQAVRAVRVREYSEESLEWVSKQVEIQARWMVGDPRLYLSVGEHNILVAKTGGPSKVRWRFYMMWFRKDLKGFSGLYSLDSKDLVDDEWDRAWRWMPIVDPE